MKARQLIELLSAIDLEAEVMIEKDSDPDEVSFRMTYKVASVTPAYAAGWHLDHMNFDVSYHINERPGDRQIVVISDEEFVPKTVEHVAPGYELRTPLEAARPAKPKLIYGPGDLD